ncbi:helicase C-terminal domain-containing protein [Coniochaeta sp. 2T2.1]|nr:helicase C-terminal domain-containing protein [Coniochaeta sp. 2T2.1]
MTSESADVSQQSKEFDFHHPYTPYDVQLQFMRVAHDVLSKGNGQVGILESPTGTGKSLSLICSALSWLRTYKKQQHEEAITAIKDGMKDEPDWMVDQMLKRKRGELFQRWQEREERLAKIRAKERELEDRGKKRRRIEEMGSRRGRKQGDEDAEFVLDEWDDDVAADDPLSAYSKETRALMESMGLLPGKKQEEETVEEDEIKIFYTSRTHSQLSQFISELRRPSFPSSVPDLTTASATQQSETVRHVPLSSRQRLCINPSVSRLGTLSAINDRCTELQQSKTKDKCPFVPNAENLSNTHKFRDATLATVPDIEDMFQLGKAMQVCPYYASRTAIPGAEIVTLPYPLLLQKSARDALGIKLEGNVVIIDEAHNIMDAVSSVYAAEIKLSELRKARQLLGIYVKRFGKKLKGENRVMVGQVARVVDALTEWMDGALKIKGEQGIVDPNLLLKAKGADQLNLFQLIKYVQQSKLAFKVESYASHLEQGEDAGSSGHKPASSPVLHTLVAFLTALTNLSTEGRVFHEKLPGPQPDIKLAYLLLSPTHAFSSIASSARAVILAGGTMSPFDDYKAHLFPVLPPEKITTLSCGHVIPPSNLCVWTLASTKPTPAGKPASVNDTFEFSFQRRSDKNMIRQFGLALLNVCTIVPDGVVVFFPSYGYLDQVIALWQAADPQSGQGASIWDRLQGKKALFRDAKGASSEDVLQQYTSAILGGGEQQNTKPAPTTTRGALLLSVVGGRMSEGINFSDRLGRCVVVVGLPYPNINSPEWKAKIGYIESATLERLITAENSSTLREDAVAQSKQAARDFYENACMRAVNQSIGRAIRHQKDYAAIVLVDRRFGTARIEGKLPGWIRGGMQPGSQEKGLHGLMGALGTFFRGKREQA